MIRFLFLGIFFLPLSLFSAETDNFTARDQVRDSSAWMNQKMNATLAEAAAATNSCDLNELHAQLYNRMGDILWAKIEDWGRTNPLAVSVPVADSIYTQIRNWRVGAVPFRVMYAPHVIRMGDAMVGSDKLGHFFQYGYEIYLALNKDRVSDVRGWPGYLTDWLTGAGALLSERTDNPEDLVLKYGQFQEQGYWGHATAGVYSYADITANFEGYRFWRDLTDGRDPYLACFAGRWRPRKFFNWNRYVTVAMDEAINCSALHSAFSKYIEPEILKRHGRLCLATTAQCASMKERYGRYSGVLVSPACR